MNTVQIKTGLKVFDNVKFYGIIALLSIAISCLLYFGSNPWHFPLDDAYIVIDNANTLLSGNADDSYSQNALVGTTSAVHLISVAFLGLFVDLPVAAFLAASLFAALYHVGIACLSMQIYPSKLIALLSVCISALAQNSLRQLYGGLETGLAMAAVVWCLSLFLSNSRLILPLLCGVMPFIRPELAALSLGVLVWRWFENGLNLENIARDSTLFLLGIAPWLVWYYFATGHLTSQTGSAKIAFFAEANLPLAEKMSIAGGAIRESAILPLLVGIIFVFRTRFSVPLLVFVCAFLGAYLIYFPSGLYHNYSRYLYILLPLGIVGFVAFLKHIPVTHPVLVTAFFLGLLFLMPPQLNKFHETIIDSADEDRAVVEWANRNLPVDARVLIHDAGYFAWGTSFTTFDLVGLKTPSSIIEHEKYTKPSIGRNRSAALNQIVIKNNITHVVILNTFFWNNMATDLVNEGWTLNAVREPDESGFVIYKIFNPML
ncbi:hypothetical protein ACFE33_13305 [Falsihalocynthiibacter sp. SS001]|uniref:hypothetical protein n=1 Tax=Falsihalocynthiibacter sp. SS001 TaxID=3349698 RepID=UPI0036D2700B